MMPPASPGFSDAVTVFHERRLPLAGKPAGYAALIDAYQLAVPWPRRLAATAMRHTNVTTDAWRVLSARYEPQATLAGHLTFALKYEGLDLAVLKRLFLATGPAPVQELVRLAPTSIYGRRIWFFYEWLTGFALGQKLINRIPLASEQ